jgi:ribosome-associated toxin RatA of RatAB toxin-antitoxin module
MAGVTQEIVIDAPPRAVYDTVIDYEKYPTFMPEMKNVIIEDREGSAQIVEFTCDFGKSTTYTLRIEHDEKNLATSWTYVGGDLKDSTGGWKFVPEGNGTRVQYNVNVTVGFMVPKFISDRLIGGSVPKMLEQVKGEVQRRLAKKG